MSDPALDPQPQLNRLHRQVKQLKSLTALLAVLVVWLIGFSLWTQLRTPKEIRLESGDSTLMLSPAHIVMKNQLGETFLDPTEMQMRPRGKSETYVALSAAGMAGISVKAEGGSLRLTAGDKQAELSMMVSNSLMSLQNFGDRNVLSLSSPHDHFFTVETNAEGVQVTPR